MLGLVAVLINVFAWAIVSAPPASAQDGASSFIDFAADVCSQTDARHDGTSGPAKHPACPQCFAPGGHCTAAILPVMAQILVAGQAQGRIAAIPPADLIPVTRQYRQRARGPPPSI